MLRFSNFGKALIGSAPTGTSGLSFTVEAGKGVNFPALDSGDYFYGIFKDASGNREIVKVEARSGDAMTIAVGGRGVDGTTARTWNAGDYFVAGITNIALQESLSNANLITLGALTSAADKLPYFTGPGTAALADLSAFARTLLDDIDGDAFLATLITSSTASTALSTLGFSAFAKTLIDDADASTARATLGLSYGPAFIASGSGPQSITPGAAASKATLGTVTLDTNSNFASSRFTSTVAGYYQINFTGNVTGTALTNAYVAAFKNGAQVARGSQYVGPAITTFGSAGSILVSMNGSTDYIELYVFADGSVLNLSNSQLNGSLARPT